MPILLGFRRLTCVTCLGLHSPERQSSRIVWRNRRTDGSEEVHVDLVVSWRLRIDPQIREHCAGQSVSSRFSLAMATRRVPPRMIGVKRKAIVSACAPTGCDANPVPGYFRTCSGFLPGIWSRNPIAASHFRWNRPRDVPNKFPFRTLSPSGLVPPRSHFRRRFFCDSQPDSCRGLPMQDVN